MSNEIGLYIVEKRRYRFLPWFFLIIPLLPVVKSGNALLIYFPQIVLGSIAVYILVKHATNIPDYIFCFWIFGLVLFLFGAVTYSGGFFASLTSGMRLFFPAVFLTIGFGVSGLIDEKKLLKVLFALLIIELLLSIAPNFSIAVRQVIGNLYRDDAESFYYGFQYSTTKRAIGSIGNPNLLCLYTDVIFTIVFCRAKILSQNYTWIVKGTCFIAALLICIETQSREGIIVFLLVLFLYLYFNSTNKKTIFISLPFDIAAVFFVFKLLNNTISRSIEFSSLSGRLEIWNNIYTSTIKNSVFKTLFGVGYQNARSFSFFDSIYLKVLVSGGVIGFAIFLICIILLVKRSRHSMVSITLVIIWIVASFASEFQETFKISSIAFFSIAYYMYINKYPRNMAVHEE